MMFVAILFEAYATESRGMTVLCAYQAVTDNHPKRVHAIKQLMAQRPPLCMAQYLHS